MNTGSNFHVIIKMMAKHGRCSPVRNPAFFELHEQYAEDRLCHHLIKGGSMKACMEQKRQQIERKHGITLGPDDSVTI